MSTSAQDEMAERHRVFTQDQSLRTSTLHQHAIADAATPKGRFTAEAHSSIVGQSADPWPKMPEGNPWAHDPVPKEEPLGFCIDDMRPLEQTVSSAQGNSGDATATSASPLAEGTAPPPNPDNMVAQHKSSQMTSAASHHSADVRAERPPYRRVR
jgi:hypothetical protein